MYYKKQHRVGIRRKFGNKAQVFSFGGAQARQANVSKETLEQIAERAMSALHKSAMNEEEASAFCKQELQALLGA